MAAKHGARTYAASMCRTIPTTRPLRPPPPCRWGACRRPRQQGRGSWRQRCRPRRRSWLQRSRPRQHRRLPSWLRCVGLARSMCVTPSTSRAPLPADLPCALSCCCEGLGGGRTWVTKRHAHAAPTRKEGGEHRHALVYCVGRYWGLLLLREFVIPRRAPVHVLVGGSARVWRNAMRTPPPHAIDGLWNTSTTCCAL